LDEHGYRLGHYPQSWELSTLGGWIAARSSGQQSLGYGRIEQMFAGGTLVTPQGVLNIADIPASSAGPDLREMMMGTEGRAGIFTEVKMRVQSQPEEELFKVAFLPNWEAGAVWGDFFININIAPAIPACLLDGRIQRRVSF